MKKIINLVCIIIVLVHYNAFSEAPKQISFQGMLTDSQGAAVADGSHTVSFSMYENQTGGTVIWTEEQIISVQNGIFNTILGMTNPVEIPNSGNLWIGIKIGEDEELSPRTRLVSVPYSLSSNSLNFPFSSTVTSDKNLFELWLNPTTGKTEKSDLDINLGGTFNSAAVIGDYQSGNYCNLGTPFYAAQFYNANGNYASLGGSSAAVYAFNPASGNSAMLAGSMGGVYASNTGGSYSNSVYINNNSYYGSGLYSNCYGDNSYAVRGVNTNPTGYASYFQGRNYTYGSNEIYNGQSNQTASIINTSGTSSIGQSIITSNRNSVVEALDAFSYNSTVTRRRATNMNSFGNYTSMSGTESYGDYTYVTGNNSYGEYLRNTGNYGYGLYTTTSGLNSTALYVSNTGTGGWAGQFNGNTQFNGSLVVQNSQPNVATIAVQYTGSSGNAYSSTTTGSNSSNFYSQNVYDTESPTNSWVGTPWWSFEGTNGAIWAAIGGQTYAGQFNGPVLGTTNLNGTNAFSSSVSGNNSFGFSSTASGISSAAMYGWHFNNDPIDETLFIGADSQWGSWSSRGNNWGGIGGENYAGQFNGDVDVIGNLSKTSGSFKIDHPLDPENKFLYHSFVESPDMLNVYSGNIRLDENGESWVQLPEWFQSLNIDFTYQLTAIGGSAPNLYIAEEIQGNKFKIAGGKPGLKVSWQVTGIRNDVYAQNNRIKVEVEKSQEEKGLYLFPELFGKSKDFKIGHSEIYSRKKN